MQRARCYLIGEMVVVLELELPVTLASQKRIGDWRSVWWICRMWLKPFPA